MNCLDEHVLIAVSKPLLTEAYIVDWRVVQENPPFHYHLYILKCVFLITKDNRTPSRLPFSNQVQARGKGVVLVAFLKYSAHWI